MSERSVCGHLTKRFGWRGVPEKASGGPDEDLLDPARPVQAVRSFAGIRSVSR